MMLLCGPRFGCRCLAPGPWHLSCLSSQMLAPTCCLLLTASFPPMMPKSCAQSRSVAAQAFPGPTCGPGLGQKESGRHTCVGSFVHGCCASHLWGSPGAGGRGAGGPVGKGLVSEAPCSCNRGRCWPRLRCHPSGSATPAAFGGAG